VQNEIDKTLKTIKVDDKKKLIKKVITINPIFYVVETCSSFFFSFSNSTLFRDLIL